MKMKIDDALTYKDSQNSTRYGVGVVTAITPDEYTILWSGRGLTKYRRAILDNISEELFQRVDRQARLPKERHLQLDASKEAVSFNENYDRARVQLLCEKLKMSGARKVKDVADGLTGQLVTKRFVLRGATRAVLLQLAKLCNTRGAADCEEARNISRELFFGYVLQTSDFTESELD
jgi:hypothetical protein